MAYNLKHTGAEIDAQIGRVIDGSVVTDNTLSNIEPGKLPVSGDALVKEFLEMGNVIQSLRELMNEKYAYMLNRGYIFKGIYDENATIDERERMVFYIAQGKGQVISNILSLVGVKLEKGRIYALKNISKTTDGYDDRWEYEVIAEGLVTEERLSEVLSAYVSKAYLQTDVIPQIEKKANTNEYYAAMAVGTADNLRGRGEATDTQFTYRPSAGAGNNIAEEGVATMKRIKGNAVVWNQTVNTPIKLASQNTGQSSQGGVIYRAYFSNVHTGAAHKCLLEIKINVPSDNVIMAPLSRVFSYNRNTNSEVRSYFNGNTKPEMFTKGIHLVSLIETNPFTDIIFDFVLPSGTTDYVECELYVHDLTQMFGVGNEPTTVEEFYELLPTGIDTHAYNQGELIPVNTESIETDGFNQWDEQWAIDGNRIYSKNFISVLPNTDYYVKGSFANGIFWYDQYKKKISTIYSTNAIVKSPATARYMKFYLGESYGTTYKNDICINLSHSGVENGRYEKYVKSVIELPEIAQCFPDGLKSAGAAFDEINETQVIKRVGVVDLGELDWVYGKPFGGTKSMFSSVTLDNILNIKGTTDAFAVANILCAHYSATSANTLASTTKDKAIAVYTLSGYKRAFVADTSYTDVETFKNAMSGVKLYFELAEPRVIELQQRAINLNYAVWDWGTERAVSSKPSAPFRADTIYGFNAVDTIRMNKADIEKLLHRVAELEARIPSAEAPVTEE